jgi:hypothetical protein
MALQPRTALPPLELLPQVTISTHKAAASAPKTSNSAKTSASCHATTASTPSASTHGFSTSRAHVRSAASTCDNKTPAIHKTSTRMATQSLVKAQTRF